jgi:hypothetical protein
MSRLILGLLAAVLLVLPVKASADPVYTIDWVNSNRMGYYSQLSASLDGHSETTWAGEINFAFVGAVPDGFASSFYAYCVDFANTLQDPESVTVNSSTGFTNGVQYGGQKAAWLFDNYSDSIHNSLTAVVGNINAAALQIAIWEAMYDIGSDLGAGRFVYSAAGAIQDQANTYLKALYDNSTQWDTTSPVYTASILDVPLVGDRQYGQDQITRGVPEPATLLMMGLGILLFFQMGRGRRTLGSMSC